MAVRKGKEYQENELIIIYNNILALKMSWKRMFSQAMKMHICEVKN